MVNPRVASEFDLRRRSVAGFLHGRRALTGSLVALGLVVTAAATYAAGGTTTVTPQLAHLFVVTAGITLGPLVGAGSGVAAGVLLGPWMPLDVAAGVPQSLEGWLVRLAVFGVVGAGTGLLAKELRDADATLRETLEQIPVAVTAVTGTAPNATISYANAAAVEMIGDVEGRTIADTFVSLRVRSLDGRLLTRADKRMRPAPSHRPVSPASSTSPTFTARAGSCNSVPCGHRVDRPSPWSKTCRPGPVSTRPVVT